MGDGRREGEKWDSQGVEGDRGGEPRSKGERKSTGGGRRKGAKWDSQGLEVTRGGNPGVMGAGSLRETGEERVRSGIPKV